MGVERFDIPTYYLALDSLEQRVPPQDDLGSFELKVYAAWLCCTN